MMCWKEETSKESRIRGNKKNINIKNIDINININNGKTQTDGKQSTVCTETACLLPFNVHHMFMFRQLDSMADIVVS